MHNLYSFSYDNISEHWEEGENGRKGRFAVNDEKGHMVDFEAVGQIADTRATLIGVCDDDDLVSTINELGRQLVDVTFDSSWLRKEEVADHSNVVAHRVKYCCLRQLDLVLDHSS